MLKFALKRCIEFCITCLGITLLAFILSNTLAHYTVKEDEATISEETQLQAAQSYWIQQSGLNLPLFYFSIQPLAFPDTIYRLNAKTNREQAERLLYEYGNWSLIEAYMHSFYAVNNIILGSQQSTHQALPVLHALLNTADAVSIHEQIAKLKKLCITTHEKLACLLLEKNAAAMLEHTIRWKIVVPSIVVHERNQYHNWFFGDGNWLTGKGAITSKGIIRGDFGQSLISRQPVTEIIYQKAGWTLLFTCSALVVALITGICMGVYLAANPNSWWANMLTATLYLLYALPVFVVAVLLLLLFANPDYLNIFPSAGLQSTSTFGAEINLLSALPYLVLPFIAFSYNLFIYITLHVKTAISSAMQSYYIRTATAKGLSQKQRIYRHALKNALFPLISIVGLSFPYLISGSVIIETVFSIPGMGNELFMACNNHDFPVLIACFVLIGIATATGTFIANVLYICTDPRLRIKQTV